MQSPVPLQLEWGSVRDQSGQAIGPSTKGNTRIFDGNHNEVRTPDGRHLTAGDFGRVAGSVSVKCVDLVTYAMLQLRGLVPNGTYSLGLALVNPLSGEPPLMSTPSDDPNQSIFAADEDGEADVAVAKSAGARQVTWAVRGCSGTQSVPVKPEACWLADELQRVITHPIATLTGSYHPRGIQSGAEQYSLPHFSYTFIRMMRVNDEIRDSNGAMVSETTPPETPLYEFRKGNPLLGPGGQCHITLGEFKQVAGSIAVKCTKAGTRVAIHMTGLIPHGVYTIWIAKPDPANPAKPPEQFGALGSEDGATGNSITADGNGEAYISATNPGGKLSGAGTIGACWLQDEPMVQVAGVYHIDGQAHGATAGPDGTYAGQFAFVFVNPGRRP
jgi:hypothetical protein